MYACGPSAGPRWRGSLRITDPQPVLLYQVQKLLSTCHMSRVVIKSHVVSAFWTRTARAAGWCRSRFDVRHAPSLCALTFEAHPPRVRLPLGNKRQKPIQRAPQHSPRAFTSLPPLLGRLSVDYRQHGGGVPPLCKVDDLFHEHPRQEHVITHKLERHVGRWGGGVGDED